MRAIRFRKRSGHYPKKLRDSLGLRPGQVVDFREGEPGHLVATKVTDEDAIDRLFGSLEPDAFFGLSVDEFIEELRGPSRTS